MHINCKGIKQFFSHNTTKKSNNFQSVFGGQREDKYCAVLKNSIVNAFSYISKEYVRSCYFLIYKIHSSDTSKVSTQF
jgi:hypothetical protein